jgi:hypothetical protein
MGIKPCQTGWQSWLIRSRFAQTAAVQAGIVLPRGAWDRGLALLETPPVPTSHYIHPEFGFFCPTPRFRRRLRVALACLRGGRRSPTPAPKATRRGRARQRSWPRRRSRRTLLLRPRTRKRRSRRAVRTIAATSTSMALRPGARSGSTIGQRAVTRETTSGAYTVAGASRPISGKQQMSQRFPAPWREEKFSGGYIVRDAIGQALTYRGKS